MERVVLANPISLSVGRLLSRKSAFGLALVFLIALLVVAGVNAKAWLDKIAGVYLFRSHIRG